MFIRRVRLLTELKIIRKKQWLKPKKENTKVHNTNLPGEEHFKVGEERFKEPKAVSKI